MLEAEEFLRVSPRDLGVTYDTGERFSQLREQFPRTIAEYQHAIDFAASELGSLRVKELEPLTTALFVTRQQPGTEAGARAAKLMQIKPHVKPAEAHAAIAKVDGWIVQVAPSQGHATLKA
ncbi:MAG TPA: hypothetical protein VNA69_06635 [Thermoanaerobaculia bacterium]|nr:hypothetical protein [Thermoanaerobaculia bacterium]